MSTTLVQELEQAEADAEHGRDRALSDGLPTLAATYETRAAAYRRRIEHVKQMTTLFSGPDSQLTSCDQAVEEAMLALTRSLP